ncbi:MAG: alpha/beta fold hydrolase [Sinobacteraceae bacterium]|nr:alpha/beta fold hydrolase [Nevskiaceae bacterium]
MLHYRIAGPEGAPTLLFLHGAGGAEGSLGVLGTLADRWRVIVPDHPGFGASTDPEWLDTIHDAAYAYLDFLEALDLRDVHLVGSSLGGWLAMEIAIRSASRLARLTLIAAAGIRPGDIPTGDLFMWSPEERVRNTIADPLLAGKILALPQTPEQAEIALRNHFTTAKLAWEPRFFDPHLDKWLHRLRLPVQVIWGAEDRLFPLALGEKLAGLIPGARLDVIPGCGHVPMVENPAALSALLREFQGSAS